MLVAELSFVLLASIFVWKQFVYFMSRASNHLSNSLYNEYLAIAFHQYNPKPNKHS